MTSRVTVAIPLWKRLEYLPGALHTVAAQDYPNIELLISDNGQNGEKLQAILDEYASMPYRLRSNEVTVEMLDHFNQLVDAAEGEYFILLQDDDELTPNYVSSTVAAIERDPDVGVAIAPVEALNEAGETVPQRMQEHLPPRLMTGEELVRIWCRNEYNFVCFATNLARTREIREVGGYPRLPMGTSIDDALLLKLALGRKIACVHEAAFQYRIYETSHGLALSYQQLARDFRAFINWLDDDPVMQTYAQKHRREWSEVRRLLVEMTWRTYRYRWKTMYRKRLSTFEWVKAAFAMPFIPSYYSAVTGHIFRRGFKASKRFLLRVAV